MVQPLPSCSRREARKRDRRDAIIAVAAQSFLDRGYAGTTMSEIASILGGSKGTLWSYYPSKEALFDAVLENATIAYRAHLAEILNPCGGIAATLERFCTSMLEKMTQPTTIALHRLVVAEAGRFPEVSRIFQDRGRRVTQLQLTEFLAAAMARGTLRQGDPHDAAQSLIGLVLAGCHQQLLVGILDQVTPAQIQADVTRTLDLFLRAYAAPA